MKFKITGIQDSRQIELMLNARSLNDVYIKAKKLKISIVHINEEFATFLKPPKPLIISQDLSQFSVMLDSALPIKDALQSLKNTSVSPYLRKMYADILDSIHNGKGFDEALGSYANIFTPMGIALIEAGIKSGKLATMLHILAEYFESLAKLRAKFFKALFYPVFVLLSVFASFIFIAWFVIPQFSELFISFGATLPLSTQSLIFISQCLQHYGIYIAICIAIASIVCIYSHKKKGKFFTYSTTLILQIPFIGSLIIYRDLWSYFLGFLYLYTSGIEFEKTLLIASKSIQNPILKQEIASIATSVKNGANLQEAFLGLRFVDMNVKNFIATAQKSGELGAMLRLCAKYYEGLYENLNTRILTYIEPFSTILMALVVGWLAFGIFLPIWELGAAGI